MVKLNPRDVTKIVRIERVELSLPRFTHPSWMDERRREGGSGRQAGKYTTKRFREGRVRYIFTTTLLT